MKKTTFLYSAMLIAGTIVATSCVDDNYDLSDIDTTTAIKVDGLTIPVKLNEITLDQVLDIDEDDSIIGVYTDKNGSRYYAIKQDGYFSADPVKINELSLVDYVTVPEVKVPAGSMKIENALVDFSYKINNVDPALLYLSYFGLKPGKYMEINLSVSPASSVSNLVIQIPDSYVASYNNQVFSDGKIPVNLVNGFLDHPIYITKMKFSPTINNVNNTLDITGKIGILSADINSPGNDISFKFSMSPFTVNVVSGAIDYEVEAPYINPVSLKDLPDFLLKGETNLILQNPQIYLDFTYLYGAEYNTEITISPEGSGVRDTYINVNPFNQSIILAVDPNDLGLPDLYTNPVKQPVPDLKYVISGRGLPELLNISLGTTALKGEVKNIELGTDPGIQLGGSYTFFTPLAFANGSQILYKTTESDFFGGDTEDVEIDKFVLKTNVTTNLPFAVTLIASPLDKEGNVLTTSQASVPANASGYELEITFPDAFKGLDGIELSIKADDMTGNSLSPEQFIRLEDIRANITGQYVTKL